MFGLREEERDRDCHDNLAHLRLRLDKVCWCVREEGSMAIATRG